MFSFLSRPAVATHHPGKGGTAAVASDATRRRLLMETTKRHILGGLAAMSVIGFGVLVLGGEETLAQGPFNAASLHGDYKYNLAQVQLVAHGAYDFCEESGTATFDGRGITTIAAIRRCSNPATTKKITMALTYTVRSNGEVTFREAGAPRGANTHGWIVDGGNMVLIDGTTKTPAGVNDLITHGVAAKQ
jgi:hypothetical protein